MLLLWEYWIKVTNCNMAFIGIYGHHHKQLNVKIGPTPGFWHFTPSPNSNIEPCTQLHHPVKCKNQKFPSRTNQNPNTYSSWMLKFCLIALVNYLPKFLVELHNLLIIALELKYSTIRKHWSQISFLSQRIHHYFNNWRHSCSQTYNTVYST